MTTLEPVTLLNLAVTDPPRPDWRGRLLALPKADGDPDGEHVLRLFWRSFAFASALSLLTYALRKSELQQFYWLLGFFLAYLPIAAGLFIAPNTPIFGRIAALMALTYVAANLAEAANHHWLWLHALLPLLILNMAQAGDRIAYVQWLRWLLAVVIFWSGLQKVLYGNYFDGRLLTFLVSDTPRWQLGLGWLLTEPELARIVGENGGYGSGPYSTSAPLMLLASNAAWMFEMVAPILFLNRRTAKLAFVASAIAFPLIQVMTFELTFAVLMFSLLTVFVPRQWLARWPLFFSVYSGVIVCLMVMINE